MVAMLESVPVEILRLLLCGWCGAQEVGSLSCASRTCNALGSEDVWEALARRNALTKHVKTVDWFQWPDGTAAHVRLEVKATFQQGQMEFDFEVEPEPRYVLQIFVGGVLAKTVRLGMEQSLSILGDGHVEDDTVAGMAAGTQHLSCDGEGGCFSCDDMRFRGVPADALGVELRRNASLSFLVVALPKEYAGLNQAEANTFAPTIVYEKHIEPAMMTGLFGAADMPGFLGGLAEHFRREQDMSAPWGVSQHHRSLILMPPQFLAAPQDNSGAPSSTTGFNALRALPACVLRLGDGPKSALFIDEFGWSFLAVAQRKLRVNRAAAVRATPDAPATRTCGHCPRRAASMTCCSRCKAHFFCDPYCFKAAWPQHKRSCQPPA